MIDFQDGATIEALNQIYRESSIRKRADGFDAVSFRMSLLEGDIKGRGDRRQIIAVAGRSALTEKFHIVEEISGVPTAVFTLKLNFADSDIAFTELEKLGIDKARAIAACRRAVGLVRGTIKRGREVEGFYIGFAPCVGPWKLQAV